MPGVIVVGAMIVLVAVLLLIARLLDGVRGTDPDDKWSGWFRSKTTDISQTQGIKGSELDTMNDHGNRGQDGCLR